MIFEYDFICYALRILIVIYPSVQSNTNRSQIFNFPFALRLCFPSFETKKEVGSDPILQL